MRKNTLEVFEAWVQGEECKRSRSIWTNGARVYSYGTVLIDRTEDGELIFNATKYSVTTSRQQNELRYLMGENYFEALDVDGVYMGCGDLRPFASVEV